jgi:hypothetical protein
VTGECKLYLRLKVLSSFIELPPIKQASQIQQVLEGNEWSTKEGDESSLQESVFLAAILLAASSKWPLIVHY